VSISFFHLHKTPNLLCQIATICFFVLFTVFLCPLHDLCEASAKKTSSKINFDDVFAPVAAFPEKAEKDYIWLSLPEGAVLSEHDIFAIYSRGEEVVDKDSGVSVGYLKRLAGFCQVTDFRKNDRRVRCRPVLPSEDGSGYAGFASAVFASRFNDLPAFCSLSAEKICDRLKAKLPHLRWTDEEEAGLEKVILGFEVRGNRLLSAIFIEKNKFSLRYFDLDAVFPQQHIIYEENVHHEPSPAPVSGVFSGSMPVFDFSNQQKLASIKAGVMQVEVLERHVDGLSEPEKDMIYLMSDAIYAVGFQKDTPAVELIFPKPLKPVAFSVLPEKAIVAVNLLWKDVGLRSMLLKWDGVRFTVLQRDINQWLAFLDMDGDGSREAFAGQSFSRQNLFGKRLYQLDVTGEGISYGKAFSEPGGFSAIFVLWQDLNQNGSPEMITTDLSGNLCIYEKNVLVWRSSGLRFSPVDAGSRLFALNQKKAEGIELYPPMVVVHADAGAEGQGWGTYFLLFKNGGYELVKSALPFQGQICGVSIQNRKDGKEARAWFIVRNDTADTSETSIYEVGLGHQSMLLN